MLKNYRVEIWGPARTDTKVPTYITESEGVELAAAEGLSRISMYPDPIRLVLASQVEVVFHHDDGRLIRQIFTVRDILHNIRTKLDSFKALEQMDRDRLRYLVDTIKD